MSNFFFSNFLSQPSRRTHNSSISMIMTSIKNPIFQSPPFISIPVPHDTQMFNNIINNNYDPILSAIMQELMYKNRQITTSTSFDHTIENTPTPMTVKTIQLPTQIRPTPIVKLKEDENRNVRFYQQLFRFLFETASGLMLLSILSIMLCFWIIAVSIHTPKHHHTTIRYIPMDNKDPRKQIHKLLQQHDCSV
ncbi:unnamed protein product [Didymodactylos carnosus]|nr:unnamed protein product [Didymodactylos carnosus]CAF3690801.1 unnamed protein product [Didymodactylos carnosus]